MAYITINEQLCKGCGLCTTACPKQILALRKDVSNTKGYFPVYVIDKDKCIGCAFCAIICPDVVIEVVK